LSILRDLARTSCLVADESIDGSVRCSLLETAKDYARQKVAARGAVGITALRDRHSAFHSAWVEQLVPNPRALWSVAATLGVTIDALSRVEAELDNIRVMLNSGCHALSSGFLQAWMESIGSAALGERAAPQRPPSAPLPSR